MKVRALALAGLTAVSLSGCGLAAQVSMPAAIEQAPLQLVAQPAAPASAEASPTAAASPGARPANATGALTAATRRSAEAAASARATPAPGSAVALPPSSIRLGPLQYIRQTLNNCGPAAIAEVLRYWGINRTQDQVQAVVRPDLNSRGMWPYGVPAYVDGVGLSSLMGVGGTPTIVKALVANGFPLIVAQWVSAADHTAHYREIEGFDDKRQVFISTDSYLGPNHEIGYAEFDDIWARGNQRFMVIYPPDKEPLLKTVLTSVGWDKTAAYQADLLRPQNPQNQPLGQQQFPQQFKGMAALGKAWDHIQLGQLDLAKTELVQAQAEGANPMMLRLIGSALTVAG